MTGGVDSGDVLEPELGAAETGEAVEAVAEDAGGAVGLPDRERPVDEVAAAGADLDPDLVAGEVPQRKSGLQRADATAGDQDFRGATFAHPRNCGGGAGVAHPKKAT